ncbi:hypothetical protein [Xanthomonas translucens]|uniref:hypothetical protein n=1 Tax=Xanthomonas campestris pv. translucens TaxID=343 RepID=UPI000A7D4A52|nr:hypothetical protein [Xanthomonas translucens]
MHGTRNGDALAFVTTSANGRVYRFDGRVESERSTALSAGATAFVHVAGATSVATGLTDRACRNRWPKSKGGGTTSRTGTHPMP